MIKESSDELLEVIKSKYDSFSKGQKLLATYIINNYEKAVFLTAAKLGKTVGVSESTVVRFATQLGYKGYPDFQKTLEGLVKNRLNSIQRLEVTQGRIEEEEILETILQSDIEKIKQTLHSVDKQIFNKTVETLRSAKTIYIVGVRSCAPIAQFLSFYLNLIMFDVKTIQTNNTNEIMEQMLRIGPSDALVGISFPRYSQRTIKALEFAKKRGANIITLTDSQQSPMCEYSDCNLIAKSDVISIVDSLVAPLSIVNALVVALCMTSKENILGTLETLEEIWDEYQVYNLKSEIPSVIESEKNNE